MKEYVINTNSDDNDLHEVHLINCNNGPHQNNKESLGLHPDCASAIYAAEQKHQEWKIDGCKHCCPDCHKDIKVIPLWMQKTSKY